MPIMVTPEVLVERWRPCWAEVPGGNGHSLEEFKYAWEDVFPDWPMPSDLDLFEVWDRLGDAEHYDDARWLVARVINDTPRGAYRNWIRGNEVNGRITLNGYVPGDTDEHNQPSQ